MTLAQRFALLLADLVLIVHAAFVGFVIVGLVLVWLGKFRGWSFVRNFWFRMAHLACIGVVALEALAGVICPLTTWENQLRFYAQGEQIYSGSSFIEYWLHRVIFFEFPLHVFTIAYVTFFLIVALSFWFVPPHWPKRIHRS